MTNPYLNFNNFQDQDLLENLIIEAIEIHGMNVMYIPRVLVSPDEILGEDRLSKFKDAYPITGYFENIQQLDGNGAMLERYGLLNDFMCNITFAIRTWNQFVGRYGKTTIPGMPMAGDLIYMPVTDQLYEIKYVNDKEPFAQLGRFYTYKCNLALFQYASEQISTDVAEINAFEDLKTLDQDHPEASFFGVIRRVEILEPGRGYVGTPNVNIESTHGEGALLIPIMNDDGSVNSIQVLDGGQGYRGEDDAIITLEGFCREEAKFRAIIDIQIESSGDKWASNKVLGEFAEEKLVNFDKNNPFSELETELVASNITPVMNSSEAISNSSGDSVFGD